MALLEAEPTGWASWNALIKSNGAPVTELSISAWKSRGSFGLDGQGFTIEPRGFWLHNAVMQRGDVIGVYCPDAMRLLRQSSFVETSRFPDVELIEAREEAIYFDSREDQGVWFASPVQTYLELMSGDKRDKETAEQVRDFIIAELERSR